MSRLALEYISVIVICVVVLLPARAGAQAITGVVTGVIVDPSGAVIPGANVTLINEETGDRRQMETASDGVFVFSGVFPGRYTVRIAAPNFRSLERTNVNLTAYERLALGRMTLELGSTAESVTVTAQGMTVQTQSMERGTVLNQAQVAGLMTTSRRFMDMLKVLPGAAYSDGVPSINGLPAASTTMIADGSPTQELGSSSSASTRAHIDSIGEVKVLTSNYQAEFGGAGGAVVQVVTKAGTNEFHGSAWWYRQHESLNANNFFQNRNSQPRARVRQNQYGWAIGGPAY